MPWRKRVTMLLISLLAACGAGIAAAVPASAHASVDATLPEEGAVIAEAPPDVLIAFNEIVTMSPDAVRLTDSTGTTTPLPAPVVEKDNAGSRARIAPFPQVEDGWYAVSWSAVSQDGHPINGTFTFYIGDATGAGTSERVATEEIEDPTERYLALAPVLRGISYLATILAVGALTAVWALSSRREPMPDKVVGRVRKLAAWSAGVGLVATPLTLMNNAIILNGGSFESLWPTARLILQSSGGAALLVRMSALFGLCTAVLLLMEKATRKVGAVIVFGAGLALFFSFAMAGHAAVIDTMQTQAYISQVLHLMAAAIWLGGVPAVALAIWSRKDVTLAQAAEAIDRFSKLATVSVVLVIIGGALLSWSMFTNPEELVTTTYGLLLIGKIAVVGFVALIGAYNHFVLVPAMRKSAALEPAEVLSVEDPSNLPSSSSEGGTEVEATTTKDSAADRPEDAENSGTPNDGEAGAKPRTQLRGTMLAEAGALVAILAITSIMTTSPAPKAAGNHLEHLGLVHSHSGGPGALSVDLQAALKDLEPTIYAEPLAGGELELSIAPGRAAADNRIVVTAYSKAGKVRELSAASLSMTQKALDLGPIDKAMEAQGDGTFMVSGRDLGVAGEWEIRVDVEFADGSRDFTTFTIDVKPVAASTREGGSE